MDEQTNNRAQMLAQIRNALGRPPAPIAPEPLPSFDSHIPANNDADLVEVFSRELQKVGGRVTHAQSAAELCQLLQDLSSPREYASVAVSACEVLEQSGMREWLVSTGKQVIPTLEEFMTAQSEHSQLDSIDEYKRVLMQADLGVTCADFALADTGTLVLTSSREQHRLISLLPPVHICLLDRRHIFASLTDFLAQTPEVYQDQDSLLPYAMTCITGPSRTADIELTISMGIHGPRALHVVLYSPTAAPLGQKTD